MVQWVLDSRSPENWKDSYDIPYSAGRIEQNSTISIPRKLYDDIHLMPNELRTAFDKLVVGFSQAFDWYWKGTRDDFRFGKQSSTREKPLTVLCVYAKSKKYVLVEIRQDELNFGDTDNLFPHITSSGKRRRGKIYDFNSAKAMVESVSRQLRNERRPTDSKKTGNIITQHDGLYLPTREDFDNTRRKCLREGRKSISIDDMLDNLEKDLKEAGHQLAENWRLVTEENMAIWSKKIRTEHDI